jgi:hypothetical protein
MTKRNGLFLIIAFLAACNDSNNAVTTITNVQDTLQEAVTDAEVAVVKQSFPELFAYLKKQDPTFSEDSFLLSGESRVEPVAPAPVDTQQLKPFQKYLIYNGDSSLALDLYSYNYIVTQRNGTNRLEEAGPDTEVAVIDFKANLRRRVFFGGPSHTLWDAQWRGPQDLLLPGTKAGYELLKKLQPESTGNKGTSMVLCKTVVKTSPAA